MLCACQRDPFAAALVTASQIASATVDRPGRRQFIWEGYSAQEEKGRGELRATGVSVNKPITWCSVWSRLPSCTSSEAADRPGTAGSVHDPWPPPWHSAFGQSLRCVSLRPCHACRRDRVRRLLGISEVGAARVVARRACCRNPDRLAGALDDGCSRGPRDGRCRGALSSASVSRGRPPRPSTSKIKAARR